MKRGSKADVSSLAVFSSLTSGWQGLVALLVGFIASMPFQTSSYGYELNAQFPWLPIGIWSDELHYADIAFLVGFVVAFGLYWVIGRVSAPKTA